jgi:hypothetical protein
VPCHSDLGEGHKVGRGITVMVAPVHLLMTYAAGQTTNQHFQKVTFHRYDATSLAMANNRFPSA